MAKKAALKGKKTVVRKAKKVKLNSPKVMVHIKSTYNNTIVNVTQMTGEAVAVSSAGTVGFAGSKKSTAYAATKAGEQAAERALKAGAKECVIIVKGLGVGRQAAVKGIRAAGLKITSLSDYTPVPHGGCRPRKRPRK